jgi:chaperonin GroEL (HSP60 family)
VDGDTGKMTDMKEYGLLESASVKIQTLKTAIEVNVLLYLLYTGSNDTLVRDTAATSGRYRVRTTT